MEQFKTLEFPNTPEGQRRKIQALEWESAQGWRLVSENIEQGKFKGEKACCLFTICAPFAFLAGHHEGKIIITLCRDYNPNTPKVSGKILLTNTDIPLWTCRNCGRKLYLETKFCPDCKLSQEEVALRE